MHSSQDNGFIFNADQNEEFKNELVLEPVPVPLASLPPEPVVMDEEFEKDIDLMMMDTVSMVAEPPVAHDHV
ncbi:hypothetical protein MKW92_023132, partial [Papaver armeniacum]